MTQEQESTTAQTAHDRVQASEKTASGMAVTTAGLLCYVAGFISGIVFILIEKENRFIRFHAMQSIFTFAGIFAISLVLNIIPILGFILSLLLVPCSIVLWILLMIKAHQGVWYKLPIVGDFAEKQLQDQT